MKKILFIILILASVFAGGCFNQSKEVEKIQENNSVSNIKDNVEIVSEDLKRATVFNSTFYAVKTIEWKYLSSVSQPIVMEDKGIFWFCVYSSVPASLQVATISGYSVPFKYEGFQNYSAGGYLYIYSMQTSLMKSKLRPILNCPFYVRMSNGVSTKESTVRISLGY